MTTINNLLPTELLVKIFSLYIETEGCAQFLKNVAPVCKLWKELSSASPLWRDIDENTWEDVLYLAKRQFLYDAQRLKVPGKYGYYDLSAVLPNIRDLKALNMSEKTINRETMKLIAEHCPNLERLELESVCMEHYDHITLRELDPILTICGSKLTHLNLSFCHPKETELLITEIASTCAALEVFKFMNMWSKYISVEIVLPIKKLQSGCPRLRKLEFSDCKIITTGWNDSSGFQNLTMFRAIESDFYGKDVFTLLKDAANLEYLQLDHNTDLVLANISKIPSKKITALDIKFKDLGKNLKAIEHAVKKWKHTLQYLYLRGCECDVTSMLQNLMNNNPSPKLKVLLIQNNSVDEQFLKTFISKCQNLSEVLIQSRNISTKELKYYKNRKEVEKFSASL